MEEEPQYMIGQEQDIEYEYQPGEDREYLEPSNVVYVQDETLYDDSNVYYEDEIVTGADLEYVEEGYEDTSSEIRLMVYPSQHLIYSKRKMMAEVEQTAMNKIPFKNATDPPDTKIPDLTYDLEVTIEKGITLPNYEINRNYVEEVEHRVQPQVVQQDPDDDDEDKLTPLPDKHFVRRGTGDAASVGLHSLAVVCTECQFCFRTKTAYSKHQQLHKETNDQEKLLPRTQIACPLTDCEIKADCLATLIEHVRVCHRREDMCYESIEFIDMEQFREWKSEMERLTLSRFTRSSGKHNVFSKSTYFHCHYSGTVPAAKPNTQRNRASKKMGKSCTAFFHIKEKEDGKVVLRGCVKHVGHEPNVKTMPLSETIKKEIATYVLEGLNEHEIVDLLREGSTVNDRRHYIQPYEVRNVHNKLAKHQYNVTAEDGDDPDVDYIPQEELIAYQSGGIDRSQRVDDHSNREHGTNASTTMNSTMSQSSVPEPSTSITIAYQDEGYAIAPPYAAVEEVASTDYEEPIINVKTHPTYDNQTAPRRESRRRKQPTDDIHATVDVMKAKTLDPNEFTKRKYDPITGLPVKRGPKSKAHKKLLEQYHLEQARLLESVRDETEKIQSEK